MGKYGKYEKKYNAEWEKLPKFKCKLDNGLKDAHIALASFNSSKGWLQRCSDDENRAYCKLCKKSLRAHKTDLELHAQRITHKDKVSKAPGQSNTLENHSKLFHYIIIIKTLKTI